MTYPNFERFSIEAFMDRIRPSEAEKLVAEGWTGAEGVEVCDTCATGTTWRAPDGKPRHRRCEKARRR